jgi:hypothetical protein
VSYCHPAIEALKAHGGDVAAVAAALGMKPASVYQVVRREGASVKDFRYPSLSPALKGDALPSTGPVLAAALVDMASMGMEVLRLQAELEQSNRIIAILTRELKARAA